ncbi:MAG: class II D-tagatose-bisphosphate aldolase, non-catalytic subunit [Saccharofermentanales bacterium]
MSRGTEYIRNTVSLKGAGIPSFCSSNEYVIKAILEYIRDHDHFALIECTANQVNQYGGYTGMRPLDFKEWILELATQLGVDQERIILGGDHLGPVVFQEQNEADAMHESDRLIADFVAAGFEKIHIDTSMRLGSDPIDRPLSNRTIAERGARLCKVAEQTYATSFGKPSELIYVVGSEVPVPGGSQVGEEGLKVTSPEDFEETYAEYKAVFFQQGLEDAFRRVLAVVVQPGVEFGDNSVHRYCSQSAQPLSMKLKEYDHLVFEGHSTDYQTGSSLKKMAEDGFAVLKVGPELTFSLREALFALQHIAGELNKEVDFIDLLDRVMLSNPQYWGKYYSGTNEAIALKRKYSFSDRWRYYANHDVLVNEIEKLFSAINESAIPLPLIAQFLPNQYRKLSEGKIALRAEDLVKDKVKETVEKYYQAVE